MRTYLTNVSRGSIDIRVRIPLPYFNDWKLGQKTTPNTNLQPRIKLIKYIKDWGGTIEQ
jgi:hypothetical protein